MENTAEQQARPHHDPALSCLVMVARLQGIPSDYEQMRRAYCVSGAMNRITLLRAAKDMGFKARAVRYGQQGLPEGVPTPALVVLRDGNYLILQEYNADSVAVLDAVRSQRLTMPLTTFVEMWSGEVILLAKRIRLMSEIKRFGLSWFLPVVLKYKRFFGEVLFVSLLLQLFGLAMPLFTQVIIDRVLVHRSAASLDVLLMGMLLAGLFQAAMTAMRTYVFTHTTNKVNVVLSSQMFRHVSNLPVRFFESWQVGDVVARVRELDNIRQFITGSALTLVLDAVFAVIYIAVMLFYSSVLSLITMMTVLSYIILNLIVTPIFRKRLNDRFLAGSETQSFLIEAVTGVQTLKTMAVERPFIDKYENLLARFAKTDFAALQLANVAGNVGTFIQMAFTAAVLWFGARIVMAGDLSVGELVAFQMLAGQVIAPILRLVNMWKQFQQTMVSVDRLGDIMNADSEPAFNPNRTTLPTIRGEVVMDEVTFRYRHDGGDVLRQVSFQAMAGTKVGIVGRSGSGKSTLTKLIQRMYVPDSGRVLIDGVDLAQVEPAWLRRQIGVVLQENFLFNGSIAENIAIADPEATRERIFAAATIAGADEFIRALPQGYETQVGERGSLLSGGQRQRVAIARALLNDPRILIFDEATSALDYESERIIMDNLELMAAGRTLIMIAHRLSTVRNCDVILVMEQGRIVEQGSHAELMAAQGSYWRLQGQQERIGAPKNKNEWKESGVLET